MAAIRASGPRSSAVSTAGAASALKPSGTPTATCSRTSPSGLASLRGVRTIPTKRNEARSHRRREPIPAARPRPLTPLRPGGAGCPDRRDGVDLVLQVSPSRLHPATRPRYRFGRSGLAPTPSRARTATTATGRAKIAPRARTACVVPRDLKLTQLTYPSNFTLRTVGSMAVSPTARSARNTSPSSVWTAPCPRCRAVDRLGLPVVEPEFAV